MHSILTGEPPPSKTNVRDTTIYPRTPKFPIKSLRRNENIHPNPPDLPKPSSNQSYLGSVSFQPYRSTRPQLLVEINAIVEAGLRDLEGRADTPSPRLSVYRMAFQRFIDEFTIYGPFLQSVKHEYDDCIDQLWERLREVATVHADLAVKDEEHAVLSRSVHKAHKEEVKALQEKIKSLELALVRKDHDVQNAQQAAAEAKDQFEKRLDEIEELRKANDMLVRSLTQLEADKAICEARELEKSGEIVTLHATIQKNLEDADKLRQNIDDLEAAQAFMIPREFIEKHEETIETQKEDLKKLEGSHKLLVQRYGALKAAIEASFRQYEEAEEARKLAELTAAAEAAAGSGAAGRGSSDGNEISTMEGEEIVSASASSSPTKRRKKGNSSVKASPVPTRKGSLVPEDSNEEHEKKSLVLSSSISSSPSKHHEDRDPLHMLHMITGGDWNPKHILEKLLDQVDVLKSELKKEQEARALLAGSVIDNENMADDGALKEEKFKSPWDHFNGLDPSISIPAYLRSNAKVQRTFLSYKETIRFIQEVRTAKENDKSLAPLQVPPNHYKHIEAVEPDKVPFSQFFESFLKEKYEGSSMAAEMSYNFFDAEKKYLFDSDVKTFHAVLKGEISDEIWASQTEMINDIMVEANKEIKSREVFGGSNEETRRLPLDKFLKLLRRKLPTKSDRAFARLIQALSLEVKGSRGVDVQKVLKPNSKGKRGKFLELLLQQHLQECIQYSEHLITCIENALEPGLHEITIRCLREAIMTSDPNKTRTEVNRLMAYCARLTAEDMLLAEAKKTPLPFHDIVARLRSRLLKRSPPPVAEASSQQATTD